MLITKPHELESLVERLRANRVFALDTEFERERTFWPKLQLIQVGIEGEVAAIDPLELEDLEPFYRLITDPDIQKVAHAGKQDAEIFFNRIGIPPENFYDTQIAAALVGLGEQAGYAQLVQRILQIRVKKTERTTDWGRRPLSEAQLDYALGDVRHLLPVKAHLDKELSTLGRNTWLIEELGFYSNPEFYNQDPDRLWMRVSGWRGLDRRSQGILQDLAKWRNTEAQRRDKPRNRIIPDDVMAEIASRQPNQISDLVPLRRLHPREIERSGKAILAAVEKGLNRPESELPTVSRAKRENPDFSPVADLLGVLLRKKARESKIASSYLGNSKAISKLVEWLSGPRNGDPPPLVCGWRKELVGNDLIALFDGKISLHVNHGKLAEASSMKPRG